MPTANAPTSNIPVPVRRPQNAPATPVSPAVQGAPVTLTTDTACRSKLDALKVVYKRLPPVSDPKGCAITDPVEISKLPNGSAITPPAMLDCETALAVVTFARDTAQQKAVSILGSTLKTFVHDSAYVCRTRNGSTKLSEHAYGRAIDIGAFITTSGDTIPVKAQDNVDPKHDAFLVAIRTAACGPFTTVLGPGSDADHALHFHFDLAPRKGKPFCQ
jgi:hypothetical protein